MITRHEYTNYGRNHCRFIVFISYKYPKVLTAFSFIYLQKRKVWWRWKVCYLGQLLPSKSGSTRSMIEKKYSTLQMNACPFTKIQNISHSWSIIFFHCLLIMSCEKNCYHIINYHLFIINCYLIICIHVFFVYYWIWN